MIRLPGKIQVWSQVGDFRKRRDVSIFVNSPEGREMLAKPLEFHEVTNQTDLAPTIQDGADFLQAALDHAWSIGMRPAGFSDVPLQLAATKYHLEDMRRLVFADKLPEPAPVPMEAGAVRWDRE